MTRRLYNAADLAEAERDLASARAALAEETDPEWRGFLSEYIEADAVLPEWGAGT